MLTTSQTQTTMKQKTLRRSQTFCTRTTPSTKPESSEEDEEDGLEEDVSSTESEPESKQCSGSGSGSGLEVEKVLANGDLYRGSFVGSVPHGEGKYLWRDGCMYSGEWRKGKANGKGKFSWPSGASYEGEFKGGRMCGRGSYIGVDGDMYRGEWSGDKKEGRGVKDYANGDVYDGEWRGGRMCGRGRYVWRNGNVYEGEWRDGVIFGKGVLRWGGGCSYEGEWVDGVPDGFGVFTREDGSTYEGNWGSNASGAANNGNGNWGNNGNGSGKLSNNGNGNGSGNWGNNGNGNGNSGNNGNGRAGSGTGNWGNNGSGSGKGSGNWGNNGNGNGNDNDNGVSAWPRGTYSGCWGNICVVGTLPTGIGGTHSGNWGSNGNGNGGGAVDFPRICIWEADEEAGEITCDIIDDVEVKKLYREGSNRVSLCELRSKGGMNSSLGRSASPREGYNVSPRPYWCGGGLDEVKKPGQPISRGHKNYELMLNLQLGIRYSVGKHAMKTRHLKASDFEPKEKFWTRFLPEGSLSTPPHQSVDFRWKDYCPLVFRHLRELFGIDPAEYMLAICGSDALREFSSPGKSGCCFYLTQDDRYMIKTVKKGEVKVLIKMLPKYYEHVTKYHNTLVTKFFGVHCVKPVGGQKTRFIVMGNLFHSEYRIHKRFDLKGSSHGRSIYKPEGEIDETTTLKDLDLKFVFRLQHSWFQELMRQVDRDCEFLEAEKIMDYSLLIGLHFRDDCASNERAMSPTGMATNQVKSSSQGFDDFTSHMQDTDWIMEGKRPFIRLGANMPARAERVSRIENESQSGSGTPRTITHGSCSGEVYEVILYFGIIDILQDYDISKKLEHAYKSLQVDSTLISAVDPKLYSKRFRDFMHRVFVEDE